MNKIMLFSILVILLLINGCAEEIKPIKEIGEEKEIVLPKAVDKYITVDNVPENDSISKPIKEIGEEKEIVLPKAVDKYITVDDVLGNNSISIVGSEITIIGVLNTIKENQACAGNCVEVPTLWGSGARNFVPLFGDIRIEDDDKLILAQGKIIETPSGTIPNFDYFGENPAISLELSNYSILSNRSYEDFSIKSARYIIKRFGCAFSHNQDVGWTIENNTPYLTVNWTYFGEKEGERGLVRQEDKIIKLYYDVDGELIKIDDTMKDYDPCFGKYIKER